MFVFRVVYDKYVLELFSFIQSKQDRKMIKLRIGLLFFFLSIFCLGFAQVAHSNIKNGPWLLNLSKSGVTIKWVSGDETGEVQWGETDSLGNTAASTYENGAHEVTLECLDPDSQYFYKAVSGTDESNVEWFYTAGGEDSPIRFIVFGDNRTNQVDHQSIVDAIILEMPDFVLNTGDLVDLGINPLDWQKFWEVEEDLGKNFPMFPVMGNHELAGWNTWAKYFSNPLARGRDTSIFAFKIANSFFIGTDVTSTYGLDSEQYAFVEQMLQIAEDAPEIDHCFVMSHFPPYSCSNHGEDMDVVYFRNVFTPLFEQYDIDAHFSGHDHSYQHNAVNDIDYLVAGGGGAPLYGVSAESWTILAEKTLNYVVVEVAGTVVTFTARRPDASLIETFSIDQDYGGVGTGKSVPEPCSDLDFDEDGLSDGEEFKMCTSPYESDTDGDGFDDGTETDAGSDPCDDSSVPTTDDDDDTTDDDDDTTDDDTTDDDTADDDSSDDDKAGDEDDDEDSCCG